MNGPALTRIIHVDCLAGSLLEGGNTARCLCAPIYQKNMELVHKSECNYKIVLRTDANRFVEKKDRKCRVGLDKASREVIRALGESAEVLVDVGLCRVCRGAAADVRLPRRLVHPHVVSVGAFLDDPRAGREPGPWGPGERPLADYF